FKAKENWNDSTESCNHDSQNGPLQEGMAHALNEATDVQNGSLLSPMARAIYPWVPQKSSDKDSGAEESNEQEEDSGITPEARSKRWFLQGSTDVYYAGLHLTEKGNPSRSIQEEPKIRINALNEVPKLKRILEGYNMHWMTKTPGKYSMEMVRDFYANYYYTREKRLPQRQQ
ncbi:hypothetical protein HAX54_034845, partial [Datura stramonium]|nr:hypothetical protein [Datura stramonium]